MLPPAVRATDPQTLEIARRLARADGETYDALSVEARSRYLDLAEEVVEIVSDDDYHLGCTPTEMLDDEREKAATIGFSVGVVAGLDQAKDRMVEGIGRLVGAGHVDATAAAVLVSRISAMGVDWSRGDVARIDPVLSRPRPQE